MLRHWVFNSGLNPLLRGAGRAINTIAGMVMGLLCNIFLDWLFIMPLDMGMRGAAMAWCWQFLAPYFSWCAWSFKSSTPCVPRSFYPACCCCAGWW